MLKGNGRFCILILLFFILLTVIFGSKVIANSNTTEICPEGCGEDLSNSLNPEEEYWVDEGVITVTENIIQNEVQNTNHVEQYGVTWIFDKEYQTGQYANGDYWVKTDESTGKVIINNITPEVIHEYANGGDDLCTGYGDGISACKEFCEENISGECQSYCDGPGHGFGNCHCSYIRHGWEVNPKYLGGQGLDSRIGGADGSLVPELPYAAEGGQSLVKVVSRHPDEAKKSGRGALQTAVVLTIVDEIPPDNGLTVFRPPYVGDDKLQYSVDSLQKELLPSYAYTIPEGSIFNLDWVEQRFRMVQLDHKSGSQALAFHARDNYSVGDYFDDYGGTIGRDNGRCCVLFMLDIPFEEKKQALINYIQYGIDCYGMLKQGKTWGPGGGHRPGMLLPLAFTAVMLGDEDMKERVSAHEEIYEDKIVRYSEAADYGRGEVIYGGVSSAKSYWGSLVTKGGNRSIADPYGIIDGSYNMPGSYQYCCTSQPLKGSVLAVYLMPELRPVYNCDKILQYIDRWVASGTWAQPDPCAPPDGIIEGGERDGQYCNMSTILEDGETCILSKDNYEVTFGPDPNNPDMCILDQDPSDGIGRFPHNHKISADEGGYRSGLVDDMWDLYRYDIPYIADDPVPQTVNSGSTVTFSVTVRSNSPINYKWLFNGHSTQHGIENMIVVDNQEDDEHKNYKIYKITLEMDSAQVEYSGNYKLEVTNDIDTVISKEATLTIFDSPEVSNLECIVEYHTAYLKWNNPANRGEDWDNLIVVRKEGSKPDTPEDGEKIYDGKGSSLVDKNLSEGDYYYAIYTYKKHDTNYVYSYPANIRATIPQLYNKHYTVIDGVQEQSLIIGQNTRGDLYTLWNEDNLTIGKGPDGNKTDIYLYSDIFGSEQEQIPAGSQIVSSRLVFKVKDYDGKDDEEPSDEIKNTRSINVYRIIDPDKLGLPFFAEKSGIRTGLDFYYRDHRPGINRAWVETDDDQIDNGESAHYSSILNMTKNIEPVEVIAFSPEVFKEDRINTIQFDITEAVQAWSDGDEEQGMFITIGQGWENNEQMMLYGLNTYKSEQPYLEIIYADSNEVLDPPAAVENLNMIPGTDSITLNWKSPDDTEVSGVKILRREGIIPSTNQDEKIVVSLTGESYLDIGESYTDSGLTTGNTYYYAVYTYNEQHDYSEKVWIKGTPGSPTIKPILNAASSGQGIVSLSWEQIDGALYYNIYRQDEGLSYDILGSVKQAQSPTFADYVMPGDYIYRVAAVNDIGEGPLSEEQSVTINENAEYKPETPDNFSGLPISGSEIKLSWDDCSDEIGYVIEKKRIDQEWVDGVVVAVLTFDMVSYIDDDLLPDTEYTYRIKAVNSSSESDYSEDINIKTSNLPLAVKNITWEVISGSQIKVEWEDTPNEDGYKVELFELTEDVEMIDGEVLDTQNLSANIVYCFFVTLEPGKEYRIVVTTIKGENTAEAYSDIIRTSSDSKGGLF